MTRQIWKFQFDLSESLTIMMPKQAQIIKVENQNGFPCIWAIVDTNAPKQERRFMVVWTGHPFDYGHDVFHVGTFVQEQFVWHLFELTG